MHWNGHAHNVMIKASEQPTNHPICSCLPPIAMHYHLVASIMHWNGHALNVMIEAPEQPTNHPICSCLPLTQPCTTIQPPPAACLCLLWSLNSNGQHALPFSQSLSHQLALLSYLPCTTNLSSHFPLNGHHTLCHCHYLSSPPLLTSHFPSPVISLGVLPMLPKALSKLQPVQETHSRTTPP